MFVLVPLIVHACMKDPIAAQLMIIGAVQVQLIIQTQIIPALKT